LPTPSVQKCIIEATVRAASRSSEFFFQELGSAAGGKKNSEALTAEMRADIEEIMLSYVS
jgi:hypothetical protein